MTKINADAKSLPIYEKRAEIVSALKSNQVIVVSGQTGSGKTTQLPLFCLEAGLGRGGKIGCTQPRRIAATSIAARVAAQMGCEVGGKVGYKIRFAAKESRHTTIKFMTDGILLAEAEHDRDFRQYDTIIIDEAHERSLNIDFLLGYLRKLLPRRPDLKVIVSSATIDAERFSESFGGAPIIEVSGRLYPIEVLYRSPDDEDEDGTGGYVENAVSAVFDILDVYGHGDMLVFMPTERDIRETCDKLNARRRDVSVLPLFSRMTRGEQDAIFNPGDRTRIVVCTNIAETSITVPNIRYVVDTGLARILRYAPRLRTNRLPIERISRASADQRKGRCGRVQEGVCIRLYSEEDYNEREEFTQPEIRRSNLAGVILTMAAHNLGDVEEFPFIESPSKQAISEGYSQLKELGALNKDKKLTRLGREMARLPFDPHISRMIIAAQKENALREVKIIAAALSIVDPRERPFEKQAEADAVHAKFTDKSSDFLTYINLWNAYQNVWETLKTQGRIRRFCKDNFLSYTRMREWHDVHQQLDEVLLKSSSKSNSKSNSNSKDYFGDRGSAPVTPPCGHTGGPNVKVKTISGSNINVEQKGYNSDAIHRSLLTGLLGNCAYFDIKTGKYKAAGGKEIIIFPGSALAKGKCEWIMCHEIVETSRVFARTVASIQPQWLEELAADFCKHVFEAPFFDAETGCVRATERVTVFGLPLAVKKNALYSKAEPALASKIFISEGLVDEKLICHHPFYKHNKKIKRKVLLIEEKLRSRTYYGGDDAIFDFYAERLPNTASIHDLNKAIKDAGNDKFLFMKEEDILNAAIPSAALRYPDHVNIGNQNFALKYAFEPGADHDGVTLALPQKVLPFVNKETLGWLLPALWPDRIKSLLQQLPRSQRKIFIPMNESAERLAAEINGDDGSSFPAALSRAIKNLYNVYIEPEFLETDKADPHLDLKIEVRDDKNNIVVKGRSADVFKKLKSAETGDHQADVDLSPWNETFAPYRKNGLDKWPADDLNKPVDIGSNKGGLPVRGFPALVSGDDPNIRTVDLVFFPSKTKSDVAHYGGVARLLELSLEKDLAWTDRDISLSKETKMMCAPFGTGDDFKESLYDMILGSIMDFDDAPRNREGFDRLVASSKESLRGLGFRVLSTFEESLRIFTDNASRLSAVRKKLASDIAEELTDRLNSHFTDILAGKVSLEIFLQYPRYLKVFAAMVEKASCEPFKYRQKRADADQYRVIHDNLGKKNVPDANKRRRRRLLKTFAQMIREYEVNVFAQHIKTLYPISEKRLDKMADEIKSLCTPS